MIALLSGCHADGSARTVEGAPSPEPAESAELAQPVTVRVPALGIKARLQPLELDRRGRLQPPAYGRAGWYAEGPEPGEPGAAVIAGHLDSTTGPDVFATLAQARRGHRVLVDLVDGTVAAFRVVDTAQFSQQEFPTDRVYADVRRPALRLITCGGDYDTATGRYLDNVVVFAAALGPAARHRPRGNHP
jgi:LPXTG-site transpeptidase (sortase) family protein